MNTFHLIFAAYFGLIIAEQFSPKEWDKTPQPVRTIDIANVLTWLTKTTIPPKKVKLYGSAKCIEILRQEDAALQWACRKKLIRLRNGNKLCLCIRSSPWGQSERLIEV